MTKALDGRPCRLAERPSLVAMQLHVLAYFGAGMVMSSWVWNAATFRTWGRFLRRKCWGSPEAVDAEQAMPRGVKKHQVIAQAFSRRGELNQGRLSLSFQSMHEDPLGKLRPLPLPHLPPLTYGCVLFQGCALT